CGRDKPAPPADPQPVSTTEALQPRELHRCNDDSDRCSLSSRKNGWEFRSMVYWQSFELHLGRASKVAHDFLTNPNRDIPGSLSGRGNRLTDFDFHAAAAHMIGFWRQHTT